MGAFGCGSGALATADLALCRRGMGTPERLLRAGREQEGRANVVLGDACAVSGLERGVLGFQIGGLGLHGDYVRLVRCCRAFVDWLEAFAHGVLSACAALGVDHIRFVAQLCDFEFQHTAPSFRRNGRRPAQRQLARRPAHHREKEIALLISFCAERHRSGGWPPCPKTKRHLDDLSRVAWRQPRNRGKRECALPLASLEIARSRAQTYERWP